jgi:penicillin-binding protein 1A
MDPRGSRVASDYVFQEDFPEGLYCTVHTADSVVTVCTDSPILDSDGDPTGLYHIAGPHCPEDSLTRMCLPDYVREHIGTATAQDERYRKSVVESYGVCTVHTEASAEVEQPEEEEPDEQDQNQNQNQSVPPSWLGVSPWDQTGTDSDDVTEEEPSDAEEDEPGDGLDLPQTGQEDIPTSEDT